MKEKDESVEERLKRMKKDKEEAKAQHQKDGLMDQLAHKKSTEPDFAELAKKLEERKGKVSKKKNDEHVKMTIYVREDIAASFNALITERGQQKEFANQALADFVKKKVKELGL